MHLTLNKNKAKAASETNAAFLFCGLISACQKRDEPSFFEVDAGGDPAWIQHVFWFFGHPEAWWVIGKYSLALYGIAWVIRQLIRRRQWALLGAMLMFIAAWIAATVLTATRLHEAFSAGGPITLDASAAFASLALQAFLWLGLLVIGVKTVRWLRAPVP